MAEAEQRIHSTADRRTVESIHVKKYNRMRDHAITALIDAGATERARTFALEWPREEG